MHKSTLTKYIPLKASDIKALIPAQVVFLLTIHDLETMRSSRGYVASITTYFLNKGINSRESLSSCMDSIAEKVMRGCLNELNTRVMQHALPVTISSELQNLLVASCHRIARARDIAGKYLHRMITSLPSLMCDEPLVCAILEVLTLLRHACEGEYTDEVCPILHLRLVLLNASSTIPTITLHRQDRTLRLSSPIHMRLATKFWCYSTKMLTNGSLWALVVHLLKSVVRCRYVQQALSDDCLSFYFQKYLAFHESIILPDVTELGAALALQYACRIQPDEGSIGEVANTGLWAVLNPN